MNTSSEAVARPYFIASLRVKGFKSFGKEWVEFPLGSPHFVAITGPNGCGKSNLLEAVCFASGCPASTLRVKALKEVASSDADVQLCEVEFQVRQVNTSTSHWVRSFLTHEGARCFQIDRKNKTVQQLKDFLRDRGLNVDQITSVIRQAQVTKLADCNNATQLADIVAGASGLSRWSDESAQAADELAKTRSALDDIRINVQKLEQVLGADQERLNATTKLQSIERELEALAAQLSAGCQAWKENCDLQLAVRLQEHTQLQAEMDTLQHQLQQVNDEIEQLSEVPESALHHKKDSAAARKLQQRSAVLQQHISTCQQQLKQQQMLTEQFEAYQRAAELLQEQADATAREIEQQHTHMLELQGLLDGLLSGQQGGAQYTQHLEHCISRCQQQQVELQVQLAHHTEQCCALQQQYNAEQKVLYSLKAQTQANLASRDAAQQQLPEVTSRLQEVAQQLAATQQHVSSDRMQADVLHGTLCMASSHATNRPKGRQGHSAMQAWQLHDCFGFHQQAAPDIQDFAVAFGIIAGSALNTVVCDSSKDAVRLMDNHAAAQAIGGGGKLRIWPLDKITSSNRLAVQRKAQAALGPDKVWIPQDLVSFEPKYQPAIQRALGGYVIAADQATAARLVEQYGLRSVTLSGVVSHKGSVSGGYHGDTVNPAASKIFQKIQHDTLIFRIHDQERHTSELRSLEQQLAQNKQQIQVDIQKAIALSADLEACSLTAAKLGAQMEASKSAKQQVAAQLQKVLCDLASHEAALLVQQQAATANEQDTSHQVAMLAKQLAEVQRQLYAAESEHEKVVQQADRLHQDVERHECQLARLPAGEVLMQRLEEYSAEFAGLKEKLEQAEAAQDAWDRQQQASEAHLSELQAKQVQLQRQLKTLVATSTKTDHQLKDLQNQRQLAEVEISEIAKQFPDAVHGMKLPSSGPIANATSIQASKAKLKQLTAERSKLGGQQLAISERLVYDERLQAVAELGERVKLLAQAADMLEDAIQESRGPVLETNRRVFFAIKAKFEELCAALLSSMTLSLHAPSGDPSQGVVIRFQRRASTDSKEEWSESLEQLSGGQRTLVSLALLLAAAKAGSHSSVFLMDEVDAALDEQNQQSAARMLRELSHRDGCQIICVTHNAAFQQQCDAFVRVCRDAQGTKACCEGSDKGMLNQVAGMLKAGKGAKKRRA